MADYITTNDDLLDYDVIPDGDLPRLGTERLEAESPAWKTRHSVAWSRTLQRLAARDPKIEESDLDDPTELKLAVCYMVAHLAYRQQAGSAHDLKRADLMYQLWEREVEEVRLTIQGAKTTPGSWGFHYAQRS